MNRFEKILDVKNLYKNYRINKETTLEVLQGVDFDVKAGEMVAVMGASGCGKTTLINLISGVDRVDSGNIFIKDKDITSMKKSEMAIFRRNNIGLVFQDYNLLESLNVKDNILIPLILDNKEEENDNILEKVLKILSIEDIIDKNVTDISGGQKQRVAIARALINTPKIILADEPTGNLDAKSTRDVMKYLKSINEKLGVSLLMVTHDSYAATYCSKVILLKEGEIVSMLEKGGRSQDEFLLDIYEFLKQIGGE